MTTTEGTGGRGAEKSTGVSPKQRLGRRTITAKLSALAADERTVGCVVEFGERHHYIVHEIDEAKGLATLLRVGPLE